MSAEAIESQVDLGERGVWNRVVVPTPWLDTGDDVVRTVSDATADLRNDAAFVAVTEKVVALAAGLAVDATTIRVGRLARFLAGRVRPRGNSLALSVPEKMQWVVDEVGVARICLAAFASAVTRPFGYDGAFYRIAGENARSVDGVRGAYPDTILPPLSPELARRWCDRFEATLGVPVAIIDLNDRGGSVRMTSPALDRRLVADVMSDNPLGSGRRSTPVAVIRRVGSAI